MARSIRGPAAAFVLAVGVFGVTSVGRADPLILDHHGFHVDLSSARGTMPEADMIDAVTRQIDIVEQVSLKPAVVSFMRSIKVRANRNGTGMGPGHYSSGSGVELQVARLEPGKPILLHELLHAFNERKLPNGFANSDIATFYDRGKSAGFLYDEQCTRVLRGHGECVSVRQHSAAARVTRAASRKTTAVL